MVREGVCTLAFDGWTGPQHLPCLGVSAILPSGKTLLLKLQVQEERETGQNLAAILQAITDDLQGKGIKVFATIADNAHNVQNAGSLLSSVSLNCCAHSANLLLKDLCEVFKTQWQQLQELETFFRIRHRPVQVYNKNLEATGGLRLRQPVSTRWGSQVDCLESVLKNSHLRVPAFSPICSVWIFFFGNFGNFRKFPFGNFQTVQNGNFQNATPKEKVTK